MKAPSILAVILNYRTPDMTLEAAESALRELEGLNGELVIVDNNSGDGSFEAIQAEVIARQWPVRVVQSGHNGGFGAGNNFGMRSGLSTGQDPDFYYILNSDAFPDAGSIRALRDYLVTHANVALRAVTSMVPQVMPIKRPSVFPLHWVSLRARCALVP